MRKVVVILLGGLLLLFTSASISLAGGNNISFLGTFKGSYRDYLSHKYANRLIHSNVVSRTVSFIYSSGEQVSDIIEEIISFYKKAALRKCATVPNTKYAAVDQFEISSAVEFEEHTYPAIVVTSTAQILCFK